MEFSEKLLRGEIFLILFMLHTFENIQFFRIYKKYRWKSFFGHWLQSALVWDILEIHIYGAWCALSMRLCCLPSLSLHLSPHQRRGSTTERENPSCLLSRFVSVRGKSGWGLWLVAEVQHFQPYQDSLMGGENVFQADSSFVRISLPWLL